MSGNPFEQTTVEPAGRASPTGFPPIRRRERISMRDPQLSVVDIELEVLRKPDEIRAESATDEARRIVEDARRAAEEMLQQARASCDSVLRAARDEGYGDGFAQGVEAADRETAGLIATAEAIATNVARERDHLLSQAEGELVELAMHVARRVVNTEVSINPDIVVEVCRGAMRRAFQRDSLVVLAHPADLEALRAAGPAMAAQLGGVHSLDFVEERRLERGGVIVRTPVGEIDATFEAKAAKLEDALREHAEQRRAAIAGESASGTAAERALEDDLVEGPGADADADDGDALAA
jgi:flagellar biosynthesis/type III secretory pathway protein FliH